MPKTSKFLAVLILVGASLGAAAPIAGATGGQRDSGSISTIGVVGGGHAQESVSAIGVVGGGHAHESILSIGVVGGGRPA